MSLIESSALEDVDEVEPGSTFILDNIALFLLDLSMHRVNTDALTMTKAAALLWRSANVGLNMEHSFRVSQNNHGFVVAIISTLFSLLH